ncbi:MAG: ABC transporter substrate-binding protein [Betaproteobacteria bacterium]|nr:MAG: ABC transporter substrate-binding protein [Betaproteobacteria bacterium]
MKTVALVVASLAALLVPDAAPAQSWPSRPVRIVVPFPPGGGTDVPARLIAAELSTRLGQQVIVENKPGAGGNLGADAVAKAPKDGYTLLMGTVNITSINPLIYPSMPFDPVADLAPVALTGIAPNVLVVSAEGPIRSLDDLIAAAKREPGRVTFASAGPGTTLHLAGELLKTMAGAPMTHVPYKGAPAALPDVMTGQVTCMFVAVPAAISLIRGGKLHALAVSGLARVPALPDVPTVDEAGLKGFDAVAWHGLFATAGTPTDVVRRLNAEVVAILDRPDVRSKMEAQGLEVRSSTPAALGRMVVADRDKWADVVRRSGAKLD